MITIVDYKAGNLASVQKAFARLGYETRITDEPEVVSHARKIVLPGVGHFRATLLLNKLGVRDAIEQALAAGTPFLGVCVGMQWMFEASEEAPGVPGLGVFAGACARFSAAVKSPHVGWNQVCRRSDSCLLRGLPEEFFVYYTHSYRAPVMEGAVAHTEYGGPFAAVIERDHLFGVQFHPEKSGDAGLRLLDNFARLSC